MCTHKKHMLSGFFRSRKMTLSCVGEGIVSQEDSNSGWWHVVWDTGNSNVYRFGAMGAHDLELVPVRHALCRILCICSSSSQPLVAADSRNDCYFVQCGPNLCPANFWEGFEGFQDVYPGNFKYVDGLTRQSWAWNQAGVINQASAWGLGSGSGALGSDRVAFLQSTGSWIQTTRRYLV
jgi:hypothetical protein